MSRMHKVVALLSLCMGLTHSFSWDFVVGARNKLEFYNNGAVSHVEDFGSDLDIEHLAYDVVHNRLLLVDGNRTSDTFIYSFTITTKEILPLVKRRLKGVYQSMNNLAYDPVTEKLFWTELFSIYWFSLKPGFVNNDYGTVLFKFEPFFRYAIAVDSCKGYVYWSNEMDRESSTIEKARFDGSERELVLDGNMRPIYNLVIDQQTQKMYWTDDNMLKHSPYENTQFSVNSADLNGENKRTLYIETEKIQPRALAVSKDSVYWVPMFDVSTKIWQLPKNPTEDTKPTAITVSGWFSNSVAVNYNIEDQIQGIQDCDPLRSLLPKSSVTNE